MPVTGLATESRPYERTQKPRILRIDGAGNLTNTPNQFASARNAARDGNAAHAVLIGCAMLVTFRYGRF